MVHDNSHDSGRRFERKAEIVRMLNVTVNKIMKHAGYCSVLFVQPLIRRGSCRNRWLERPWPCHRTPTKPSRWEVHHTCSGLGKTGNTRRVQQSTLFMICKSAASTALYTACLPFKRSHRISTLAFFYPLYCYLLVFAMYGVAACRFPPTPNYYKLMNLTGSSLAHDTPCHQVSWKRVTGFLQSCLQATNRPP